ncbi:MAG: hypothetical protein WCO86_17470 [Planctomycetota bacterium]
MNNPLSEAAFIHLTTAHAYFCFARVWWDGDGLDVASWWQEGAEWHMRLAMTGETTIPMIPTIRMNRSISESEFSRILGEMTSLGIASLASQLERTAYTHYDVWYGIRHQGMPLSKWVWISGGIHDSPVELELLKCVYKHCPELIMTSTA